MGEDRELKVGMLTKRAQQKRSISRTNYKERVFALTQTHLAYYEGNLQVDNQNRLTTYPVSWIS